MLARGLGSAATYIWSLEKHFGELLRFRLAWYRCKCECLALATPQTSVCMESQRERGRNLLAFLHSRQLVRRANPRTLATVCQSDKLNKYLHAKTNLSSEPSQDDDDAANSNEANGRPDAFYQYRVQIPNPVALIHERRNNNKQETPLARVNFKIQVDSRFNNKRAQKYSNPAGCGLKAYT